MPIAKRVRTKESKQGLMWFYNLIKKSDKDFKTGAFNPRKDPFIGGLFMFKYEAKLKDQLPYWDAFPLVIPFGVDSESFIGLNLHYLPNEERKRLLEFLLKEKAKRSNRDYIKISYELLKASSHQKLYEPCIHRYLMSHLRTRLVKVDHEEWENVLFLPVAQWQKGTPY